MGYGGAAGFQARTSAEPIRSSAENGMGSVLDRAVDLGHLDLRQPADSGSERGHPRAPSTTRVPAAGPADAVAGEVGLVDADDLIGRLFALGVADVHRRAEKTLAGVVLARRSTTSARSRRLPRKRMRRSICFGVSCRRGNRRFRAIEPFDAAQCTTSTMCGRSTATDDRARPSGARSRRA